MARVKSAKNPEAEMSERTEDINTIVSTIHTYTPYVCFYIRFNNDNLRLLHV